MKPKSVRMRFLKTIYALIKYTDKNHRTNLKDLNERFLPDELCYKTNRSLAETIDVLREFGLDIKRSGRGRHDGIWNDCSLISNQDLYRLNFAITTNPYLSKEESQELLNALQPFTTVYQEPILTNFVDTRFINEERRELTDTFGTIAEAIHTGQCIRCQTTSLDASDDAWLPGQTTSPPFLFVPKCFSTGEDQICVTGYAVRKQKIVSICLQNLVAVKLMKAFNKQRLEIIHAILQHEKEHNDIAAQNIETPI